MKKDIRLHAIKRTGHHVWVVRTHDVVKNWRSAGADPLLELPDTDPVIHYSVGYKTKAEALEKMNEN